MELYEENGKLKDYINETFYLDYLVANSIENEKFSDDSKNNKEAKKELTKKLIGNTLNKIMEFDPNITEDELKDIIGEQVIMIKQKNTVSTSEINKIIKKSINDYVEKIENYKI